MTGFKDPRWSAGTLFEAREGSETRLLMRFEGDFKSSIRLVEWKPPDGEGGDADAAAAADDDEGDKIITVGKIEGRRR